MTLGEKVEQALACIRLARAQSSRPYVACSFGKDSSVVLHLAQQVDCSMPAVFVRYDETDFMDNYDEVMAQWSGVNIIQLHIGGELFDDTTEGVHLDKWALENGFDCALVGMRAQESRGRAVTLKKDGLLFKKKNGLLRCCPIGFWSVDDVEAYTKLYDLPLLNTYKRAGFSARTTSGTTVDKYGFREQQLRRLRRTDPARFNQLKKRYPEVTQYV